MWRRHHYHQRQPRRPLSRTIAKPATVCLELSGQAAITPQNHNLLHMYSNDAKIVIGDEVAIDETYMVS